MTESDIQIPQGVDALHSDVTAPEVNQTCEDAFQPHAKRDAAAKVGRNCPCPCGSGMKYKRCCGLAEKPTTPCDTTHDPSSPQLLRPESYRRCESNTLSAATPGSQIVEMFLICNETQHLDFINFSCDVDYFDSQFVAESDIRPGDIISGYKVKYDLSTRKVVDVECLQPDWTFTHFNTAYVINNLQKTLDNWPDLPMDKLYKKLQHQQEKAFGQPVTAVLDGTPARRATLSPIPREGLAEIYENCKEYATSEEIYCFENQTRNYMYFCMVRPSCTKNANAAFVMECEATPGDIIDVYRMWYVVGTGKLVGMDCLNREQGCWEPAHPEHIEEMQEFLDARNQRAGLRKIWEDMRNSPPPRQGEVVIWGCTMVP
ncbi:MAG: SEC-C metal-binding domain-containing protein [Terriglobia bacterium]